ncbi:MAG: DUF1801 domain-containing protein [Phycisphaerales bacterium]
MPTAPATVSAYLDALPADRRAALGAVRDAINKALPKGYAEGIQYGMIGWHVPHAIYPPGYHCDPRQPLPFVMLGSQKHHMALHMFCIYGAPDALDTFTREWKATGKKLDMGKACVRFKKIEDVPLEVVARAVSIPVQAFVDHYEGMLATAGVRHPGKKGGSPSAGKPAGKKTSKKTAKKAPAKKATKKTAKKPIARKASKKPTTKKPAAKKSAIKKPATKKPATKRPAKKSPAKRRA